MGTIECSQPASKSSWDSQDFGDISMVLKMAHFASPPGHDELNGTLLNWVKYARHLGNVVNSQSKNDNDI